MDLVQRYIAAVQRDLPEAKRQEIGDELHANIMDQLDALTEQKGSLCDADIAALLKQMGHPRTLAQNFSPPQPLVSASYMPLYQNTLFMVLGVLFLLQLVASTNSWLANSQMSFMLYLKSLASGFLEDAMLGFTTTTLVFWMMSHSNPGPHNLAAKDWQPGQLPPAGQGWQHIALQDIFTDLATYVFLLIVIWYPLWLPDSQSSGNRFLLTDTAQQLLRWASPLAVLGVIGSLWQLNRRIWSQRMLMGNIVLNSAFFAVILALAASSPLISIETDVRQGVFALEQLERAAVTGLVITAMFPLWEVVRDLRRLRKLRDQGATVFDRGRQE